MTPAYSERLHVPLRWWVQATMFLATFWIAFIVAMPAWLAWTAAGALAASTYALFLWVGSARVAVQDGELFAGPAHISLRLLGAARPLDAEATRRVHGPEADARAFLVTRPYVKRAVLVPVEDPADPTPYWLVSTRHPDALAAALSTAGDTPRTDG
ncbi:MAG TPA: DUF3093 domain-containing protein [Marmoricola sp.]|nr:DUF3093 domain-containing protein [Marmoricola sp.]